MEFSIGLYMTKHYDSGKRSKPSRHMQDATGKVAVNRSFHVKPGSIKAGEIDITPLAERSVSNFELRKNGGFKTQ
jgi:hypothetical protein